MMFAPLNFLEWLKNSQNSSIILPAKILINLEIERSLMKLIYVFLIALSTGILGFLLGGSLGLLGGGSAGTVIGAAGGMCATIDVALAQGLITETEAEQLGNKIGQSFRQRNPNLQITMSNSNELTVKSSSPTCEKFLAQVRKGLDTNQP
ncbi:MAG: hypothetical protein ACRC8A_13685 [Microcoleaceae cyanobacterium]